MAILERDSYLSHLHDRLKEAVNGQGRLVFLGAESGGGKTTLVEQFKREIGRNYPVTIASCDGLGTSGPFGGLMDIASAIGPEIEAALHSEASRDRIFHLVLSALRGSPHANVIVGEDAHWSDEASLDLIRFIGRRIASTHTLLIVTYRDDVLDHYHPLRRVLGDLINEPAVSRLWLEPLSVEAVSQLAEGTEIDPVALRERTGGNPFYVTESVAGGGTSVPSTIRDAVLGRASRVSIEGRAVLDAASAIGPTFDLDLLEAVVGAPIDDAVEECLAAGMFRAHGEAGDVIGFRHGLTKTVFLTLMSAPRRRGLHRRILQFLEQDPVTAADLPRLAHHAVEAHDREAVLRYAPAAAKHAAAFGAHRQAAEQYGRTLRFAHGLPDAELVELLEARSYECYLTGQLDEAIDDRTRAVELCRGLGDPLKTGDNLRWLSRFYWFAGNKAEAEKHGRAALTLLETLPPGPELAMAYSNLSQLRMLSHDAPEAIRWGERAIELATSLDNQPVLAHALTNVGTARMYTDDDGRRLVEQGAAIARESGLHDDVARSLANLAYLALEHYEGEIAEPYIVEGLEFTSEHDLLAMHQYMRAQRAHLLLGRGLWDEATSEACAVAGHPSSLPPAQIVALTALGQIRARRGEDPSAIFDDALLLAEVTGELMRLGPLRAARAEAAWLAGDPALAAAEAEREYANAVRAGERWLAGRLAIWLHRGGRRVERTEHLAEPFAFEIAGDGKAAAEVWHARGYPLEEGRALVSTGDEESLRQALTIFDRLGAKPDAARTTQALRAIGARNIPRGPRAETRANVAHLTARELDVLGRVTEGQSNREIADALFLSPRTVGHHVSAILAKLQISSRTEARAQVEALGLFSDRSSVSPR